MPDTPTVTPLVARIAEILDTERSFRLYYSDDGRTRVAEKIAAALRPVDASTISCEEMRQRLLTALERPVDDAGLIERVEAFASWLETLHYKNLAVHDSPTLRASDLRAIVAVLASSEKEVGRLRGALEHIQRMNLDDGSTYDLCAAALKGRVEGEK